jgi:(2Fe-2S) ferredoxin
MSYYQYHAFLCTNKREDGRRSCGNSGSAELRAYAKARIKELGLSGEGKVRVNTAGCLDRCHLGPVMVIYPEEVWYSYRSEQDVDEIIEQHFVNNQIVERLLVKD